MLFDVKLTLTFCCHRDSAKPNGAVEARRHLDRRELRLSEIVRVHPLCGTYSGPLLLRLSGPCLLWGFSHPPFQRTVWRQQRDVFVVGAAIRQCCPNGNMHVSSLYLLLLLSMAVHAATTTYSTLHFLLYTTSLST